MCVNGVEGPLREAQPVDVAGLEGDRVDAAFGRDAARDLEHLRRRVDPRDLCGGHPFGEIAGERARATADVEQGHSRVQVLE